MVIKLIAAGARPWELWLGYWGLSYLIDGTLLYDTFCNYRVLKHKLKKAKVDLSTLEAVVLSHDHWDHTGGLWGLLKEHPGIDVYVPPTTKQAVKRRITSEGGKLFDSPGMKTLKENVTLSDEMIGVFNEKAIAEQFLLVKTENGFVIIVGCSHPGIVSIVQKAKETFGVSIYGVVGGLHLMNSSTKDIYTCAHGLKSEGVKMVAPTHCTGMRAERIFKSVFGKGFVRLHEAQTLSLPPE